MFVLTALLGMAAMAMLIFILIFFAYKILQTEKNPFSWFTLIIILFFLGVALLEILSFINVY